MSKHTILLVDDDPDIREFISFNLVKEGFKVETAKNGLEGVEMCKKFKPDLVLLDVMMPGMDGMEACEAIRATPEIAHTVIAFLSARGEDYSQVAGFESGGDDYITKPIRPKVLVSRIKALLRRNAKSEEGESNIIERGDLRIDLEKYQVHLGEGILDMPRKEFELLQLLAILRLLAVEESRHQQITHRAQVGRAGVQLIQGLALLGVVGIAAAVGMEQGEAPGLLLPHLIQIGDL